MKKFIAALCAALVAAVISVTLAACGGGGVAGTYKLASMSMAISPGEDPVVLEVGDEYMGEILSEDFYTLELKDDNTFTMHINVGSGETSFSQEQDGTWELDGNKLSLTAEGETVEGTLEDGTITMTMGGEGAPTIVMKK